MSQGDSPKPDHPTDAGRPGPVVRTRAGAVRGVVEEHHGRPLAVFRGVPYAQPPVGPLRFASPRPPLPWQGVRDATRFAPAFLQSPDPHSSEDALYANVWTPDPAGRRPVLVYIHGGGWQVGAGSVPTFDGAKPAARGDIVVVNFNYRLGVFGWGLHDDLTDPDTGHRANWGLQDQLALLRWVRDNAEAFGGDPHAVTLCGTSAGGATARQLVALPETRGLVGRLVAISAAHPWAPACSLTPEDATTVYEALAKECGTSVRGLRDVPADRLHRAWLDFFAAPPAERPVASGREYRGPVLDGRTVPAFAEDLPVPDIPVMSVHNSTEGSFFTDPLSPSFPPAPPAPRDDAELVDAVHGVLLKLAARVPDGRAEECVAVYRDAAAAHGLPADPRTLWTEIWGDALFRHRIVRQAERHAREGRSPQYVMEFAHPVRPPHHGTPHDATSKFLFGTHAHPLNVGQFGDGPLERRISDTFTDLVTSFVRGSAPTAPHAPDWPVFSPRQPTTLILGGTGTARLGVTPKLRPLRFWDGPDRHSRP
ncbi:carboxylesterase/lipase family protein [Streptomyces griseosporeus]|uniref:carboxylesterase/lipase family protein n=1 Tax=Streptomyces griseosporeus TaxID=1910 RepID=UPI0036FC32FA